MNIGLFGGTFDPVHLGHLLVAQAAREELSLDQLAFIPAARSPFKPDYQPAPGAVRLAMLRLALAGRSWCSVNDTELRRGGTSYTIDTVREFAGRFPGASLTWLIGEDHVSALPRWKDSAELAQLVGFAVIPRPNSAPAAAPSGFRLRRLVGIPFAVSASQIRGRIQAGLPVDVLVPLPVAEFIQNNRLYL